MAEVKLFKKQVQYQNKDGDAKIATNYFVQCGDVLVSVEVKYFESKETGRDDRYRERRVLMSAFAEELPEKESGGKRKSGKPNQQSNPVPQSSDDDIPF